LLSARGVYGSVKSEWVLMSDGEVGAHAVRSGTVQDRAAADEQIVHVCGNG